MNYRNGFFIAVLLIFSVRSFAEIKFAGCSISTYAYMKEMAKVYHEKTGIKVDVRGGGVPLGIKALLAGKIDVAGSCRHTLKHEKNTVATIVGYDALTFIVHPENPVDSVNSDQIRGLFSGSITNWKEIGGFSRPVLVVGREPEDAGVAVMFKEMVMGDLKPGPNIKRLELLSSSEAEKEIETNQVGIAVTGISSKGKKVKILKVNGVELNHENFKNGKYLYVRPLYLITRGKPKGEVAKFVNFILGPEGQQIVSKNAFTIEDFRIREKTVKK